MRCIVTAGPTFEPLDEVRRLTNFSTGRLGSELANFLAERGHEVTLLIGELASHPGERHAQHVETFTTTLDLRDRLIKLADQPIGALFHAAAVSDFRFGQVWVRSAQGEMTRVSSGKFSTRQGTLVAELVPTAKIIAELRSWFPRTRLVGWKFEVEGDRAAVIRLAQQQVSESNTDACVANGPAYGSGFGLVRREGNLHLPDRPELFAALHDLITQ
jgi:phosphopantothenate---cysteine ligase (CTP)